MAVVTYQKNNRNNLTKNFAVAEFACHGTDCCSTVKIDDQLAEYLQKIRDHFGKPVTINSGYRCPTHNKRIGGTPGSYHAKGMAADIAVKDVAPAEVAKYAESIGIKGIGLYETAKDGYFVHVDTRTVKSFWYGQSEAYRSTFGGKPPKAEYTQKEFIKDIQKACGAAVDGIAGPETLSKTVTLSAKKNITHAAVKPVQKYLKALGYNEVGDADGHAGPKFTSAVAHYQQDKGCFVDGEITARNLTWKKLLGLA
jgi:peptidoglycan hydrolase-like protein with peptidoglycan-binding domain